jgi:hypothetical protein
MKSLLKEGHPVCYPLKEGRGLLLSALGFLLFAFGFYFGLLLWRFFGLWIFGVGSFWKGEELLKGKEWQGNC